MSQNTETMILMNEILTPVADQIIKLCKDAKSEIMDKFKLNETEIKQINFSIFKYVFVSLDKDLVNNIGLLECIKLSINNEVERLNLNNQMEFYREHHLRKKTKEDLGL